MASKRPAIINYLLAMVIAITAAEECIPLDGSRSWRRCQAVAPMPCPPGYCQYTCAVCTRTGGFCCTQAGLAELQQCSGSNSCTSGNAIVVTPPSSGANSGVPNALFNTGTNPGSSTISATITSACGISNINALQKRDLFKRITAGNQAENCEYPWIVVVRTEEIRTATYTSGSLCGGTIVDANTVITATHCLLDISSPSQLKISMNERDRKRTGDGETTVTATAFYKHAQYNDDSIVNDIAVIKIPTINFASFQCVQPICLPTQGQVIPVDTQCVLAGWGRTTNQGSSTNYLREVDIQVVSLSECRNTFGSIVGNTQLCVKNKQNPQKGACKGDSGGPLMCSLGGRWILAGIISYGTRCDEDSYPAVVTNVAQYVDTFIKLY